MVAYANVVSVVCRSDLIPTCEYVVCIFTTRSNLVRGLASITLRELTLNAQENCYLSEDLWQKIGSNLEKLALYRFSK